MVQTPRGAGRITEIRPQQALSLGVRLNGAPDWLTLFFAPWELQATLL